MVRERHEIVRNRAEELQTAVEKAGSVELTQQCELSRDLVTLLDEKLFDYRVFDVFDAELVQPALDQIRVHRAGAVNELGRPLATRHRELMARSLIVHWRDLQQE